MKKKLIFLLLIVFSLACGARSDETTPEMAQSLLKIRGFNFTEEDLFKAIKQSDAPTVKLFLQSNINLKIHNREGETPLTFAAAVADAPTVKVLLEKTDVNEVDGAGNMPLFVAIKKKRDEIFDLLLSKNADADSHGIVNKTKTQNVLYAAVNLERFDLVQKLLEKGADPNITSSSGVFPVSELILSSQPNIEIVKMMLEKITDVNKQDISGSTLLIYAAKNERMPSDMQKEIIEILLAKDADKNLKDNKGKTALDWAKELKDKDALELLK